MKIINIAPSASEAPSRDEQAYVSLSLSNSPISRPRAVCVTGGLQSHDLDGGARVAAFQTHIVALMLLHAAAYSHAQVAVDATTSSSAELTGNATRTLTFAHTTTNTGANLVLLLVGVSINITNAPATTVTGVTYRGAALTLVGAHNDAGNTRRVEMWYMLAPSTGNRNVIVSVNIPAAQTVGVVVGATTFTGVDPNCPAGFVRIGRTAHAVYELAA